MITSPAPLSIHGIAALVPADEPGWESAVPRAQKRRSPRIWQMASVAATRVLDGAAGTPRSLVVATALGALDETRLFLERVYREGAASPRNFIASVHNSMAGKLAQDFAIDGPNLTLCDAQNSLAASIAAIELLDEAALPALLVDVDESVRLLGEFMPFFSPQCRRYLQDGWKEAAVALICSRDAAGSLGSVRAGGPKPAEGDDAAGCCAGLAEEMGSSATVIPLTESCTSYVQPAVTLKTLIERGEQGRYAIPSYAPTAHAVAMVELCV